MQRPVVIGLMVVGVVLLVAGINESRSAVSQFSELFNGRPSKDALALIIAGLACLGAGAWGFIKLRK